MANIFLLILATNLFFRFSLLFFFSKFFKFFYNQFPTRKTRNPVFLFTENNKNTFLADYQYSPKFGWLLLHSILELVLSNCSQLYIKSNFLPGHGVAPVSHFVSFVKIGYLSPLVCFLSEFALTVAPGARRGSMPDKIV